MVGNKTVWDRQIRRASGKENIKEIKGKKKLDGYRYQEKKNDRLSYFSLEQNGWSCIMYCSFYNGRGQNCMGQIRHDTEKENMKAIKRKIGRLMFLRSKLVGLAQCIAAY